jgi:hypothetical protein
MSKKSMGIFGGYVSRAEAASYANNLGEDANDIVLVSVLNGPTGMPLTPLCYFPLTRSLITQLYKELKRKLPEE